MTGGGKKPWGTQWSQNQVARLTKMLDAGNTFNEIARALNRPKNAVIGKAHRMGLKSKRGTPDALKASVDARKGRKQKPKPAFQLPAPACVTTPEIKPARGKCLDNNRMTPAAHPSTRAARPSDSIWHPKTCQFPHGDPREPDFHFCGEPIPTPDGRPYCDEHHARCTAKWVPKHLREGDAA